MFPLGRRREPCKSLARASVIVVTRVEPAQDIAGLLKMLRTFNPDAPIYTSMYDPGVMPAAYRSWDIRTSFMQRLPFVTKRHQAYLMAYPIAFESFDLGDSPSVEHKAAYTKNRKPAFQPIAADLACGLRGYLAGKVAGEPIWPCAWIEKAAKMLGKDMAVARKVWVSEA